jgi:aerobic-type carbon monoxide dehydrogenase small subunit (CoxS/CutS family)
VSAASESPGVVAVLTASDMDDLPPASSKPMTEPLLATDRVRYVGEPVAIVLTDQADQGEDAAELVSVDYEPLTPVVTVSDSLAGEVLLFPEAESNISATGSAGNCEPDNFDDCDVIVERTIVNQRVAPVPLEVRAAAARWADGRLTLWASTQNAQLTRGAVAGALGLDQEAIRVIAPDVGGGFGAKIATDRDVIAVAWAARRAGRPVRWVETRNENLMGMVHGRAQRQTIKIGGRRDGRILAYHLDIVQDCGGYSRMGPFLASLTMLMASGVYDLPRAGAQFRAAATNTTPISAYRGAGRPEAAAAIERAVDLFAAEIGMDPAEVRRRNVVPPEAFPYTTATGAVYDTGEYAKAIDTVLAAAGYQELRAGQASRRRAGGPRQTGIGLSCYVEITAGDARQGETARLEVDETGRSAHLPVRRPRRGGRGGHRDRQGDAAAPRGRRRRRDHPQPGTGRRAAARRHRPGRRAGPPGGGALRLRRQPADQHPGGVRRHHRHRVAVLRVGRHGDHHHGESARRQGHRRGRHDRFHPGGAERRHRRGRSPWRPAHRDADHARARLGGDQRSEARLNGANPMKVTVTVNGEPVTADVEDRMLLVHYVRDVAGLTATNIGCDTTSCGACTVLLDGESVKSCTILAAQADGSAVLTVEGLAGASGELHPMQSAFRAEHGLQCGFCTPGMVMAAVSLLRENPDPTEEQVRAGLEGNLCRCTGYHNIVRAVLAAAGAGAPGAGAAGAGADPLEAGTVEAGPLEAGTGVAT